MRWQCDQVWAWRRCVQDLGLISDKKEAQILQVLEKIKRKDPSVFDPNAKFFSESESEEDDSAGDAHGSVVLVGIGALGVPEPGLRAHATRGFALRCSHARSHMRQVS